MHFDLVDLLPEDVKERVGRYVDPLTGERSQYRYNNPFSLLNFITSRISSIAFS